MGSDATNKSHHSHHRLSLGILLLKRHLPLSARCWGLSCILLLLAMRKLFQRDPSSSFGPHDTSHLPARCVKLASQFHACQANVESQQPVVLACHRKWCESYGHCEPCAGIGDRTLHMLSLVQEALERCIPVQLDYPQPALQIVSDATYEDPLWFQSVLHKRSYVSEHTVNVKEWGTKKSFVHFFPDDYEFKRYDMCLFHILFRPVPSVQKEIDYHLDKMGKNVIGIHFRSGDQSAFGFDNKDARATDIPAALIKMLACGQELASRLFPPNQHYTFFLATDNKEAKQLASSHKSDAFTIYRTEALPSVFLRADRERDAWVELYLLSSTRGLVVNVRPKQYEGKAGRLSMFSILAKRIGNLEGNAIMECTLD